MTKEELLNQAGALLLDTVKQIKDFSIKEIPPTIKEAVMYNLAIDWITFISTLIGTVVCAYMTLWWSRHSKYDSSKDIQHWIYTNDLEGFIAGWVFGFIISTITCIIKTHCLLQYYIAPRIYTIKIIKSLL